MNIQKHVRKETLHKYQAKAFHGFGVFNSKRNAKSSLLLYV